MADLDALRRENAALREANAQLRVEANLAREGQAACFEQIRTLLGLVEKYAQQLQAETAGQEREALAEIAKSVEGAQGGTGTNTNTYDLHTNGNGNGNGGGGAVGVGPGFGVLPGFGAEDPAASPQSMSAVTPARNPAGGGMFDMSFTSQTGGATPCMTQQIVHESPPNAARGAYVASQVVPPTPQTPEQPQGPPHLLPCPTKIQRKALLAGDAWAPKGSPFNPELVVGVPIPNFLPDVRVEPMLLGGRIFKATRALGGENTEVSFFNGTRDMQFTLDYSFLEGSLLYPGDDDVVVGEKGLSFSLTVYPGQCKVLVSGRLNGYSMHMRYGFASAACLEYFQKDAKMDAALAAASGKVRSLCASATPAPSGSGSVADLCALGGVGFVDPEFPPAQTSIARLFEPSVTTRPWIRLPDAFLYPDASQLEPQDIDPGLLGDAWLLSAIAAAAEHPPYITAAFTTAPSTATTMSQDHRAGVYRVRLCRGGWWETVIIDEWLPASPLGPAFARSISSASTLWPSLLQKAYAKLYGSYAALKGPGDPLHALTDLTGCGCDYFNWRAPDDAFAKMAEAVRHGYIVIVTAPGLEPAAAGEAGGQDDVLCKSYIQVGLLSGYSYRVVNVLDEYIVVRNAWGDCERWNGDHDAFLGTINVHKDDMGSLFDSGGVAYVRAGQLSFRTQVQFTPGEGPDLMVAVEVARECVAIITLHQKDTRGSGAEPEASENVAYCTSVVQKREGGAYSLVAASHGGTFWKGRDTVLRVVLHPSPEPYYVVPRGYSDDLAATVSLSMVFEGACEGTLARFLKPTPNVIESLAFDPIFNFEPSRCVLVRPLVQMGRGEAAASQSVSLTQAATLYP